VAGQISSGGFGRGVGKAFAAIGDTLGFDGDFGYDGVNGPDGNGRNLSVAGLGDAVGGLFDGGGADAELVFWTPPSDALSLGGYLNDGVYRPGTDDASLLLIQGGGVRGGGSRTGMGGNRPPMDSLYEIFPLTPSTPAGSILAPIDGFLGFSALADGANLAAAEMQFSSLYNELRELDPTYRAPDSFQSLEAMSWQGRNSYLGEMRVDRAAALYNVRGEIGPLQVETLRFLQGRVDTRYGEGVSLFNRGELDVHLGRNEAIGNYMDGAVRRDLQAFYTRHGVSYGRGQQVTVNNRHYDTSGTDRTYSIPDSGLGRMSYDWTLTPKTQATPQVQSFFRADSRPVGVIIIRPTPLGGSYYLTPPAPQPRR
jgi:hypothetical protein